MSLDEEAELEAELQQLTLATAVAELPAVPTHAVEPILSGADHNTTTTAAAAAPAAEWSSSFAGSAKGPAEAPVSAQSYSLPAQLPVVSLPPTPAAVLAPAATLPATMQWAPPPPKYAALAQTSPPGAEAEGQARQALRM